MSDAYHKRLTNEKPLIHSDRGAHFRWSRWIERMEKYGYIRSMPRKGSSSDNATSEGFCERLKNEIFYGKNWQEVSIDEFIKIFNEYVEWYNTKRVKQLLIYLNLYEYG